MSIIKILSLIGIVVELIGVFVIAKGDLFNNEKKIFKILRGSMGNRMVSKDPDVNFLLRDMMQRAFNTKIGFFCLLIGVTIQLIALFLSS
ncbi:hypothetical protein ACEWK1_02885 [Metabacillus sp. YM-086]|uniref:hypothetical protein n=1 Tax=Metabacillus sp. YM-086 TaxID=3341729 RepID=UPI003A8C8736